MPVRRKRIRKGRLRHRRTTGECPYPCPHVLSPRRGYLNHPPTPDVFLIKPFAQKQRGMRPCSPFWEARSPPRTPQIRDGERIPALFRQALTQVRAPRPRLLVTGPHPVSNAIPGPSARCMILSRYARRRSSAKKTPYPPALPHPRPSSFLFLPAFTQNLHSKGTQETVKQSSFPTAPHKKRPLSYKKNGLFPRKKTIRPCVSFLAPFALSKHWTVTCAAALN